MLFVLLRLGEHHYALDASAVSEVLPFVEIRPLPGAPPGVAGVFDCHGVPVPVIDLSVLTLGRPAPPRLSTRLIVVRCPDARGDTRLLGLIAERATETLRREPADFVDAGVTGHLACLGPVTVDAGRLVQRLQIAELLPPSVREALFGAAPLRS